MQPMFYFHWDFEQICPLQCYLVDNQLKNLLKTMFLDIPNCRCPQFLFFDFAKKSNIVLFLFESILLSSAFYYLLVETCSGAQ